MHFDERGLLTPISHVFQLWCVYFCIYLADVLGLESAYKK